MKKIMILMSICTYMIILNACNSTKEKSSEKELITQMDTLSYVLGNDIGKTYKNQGIELNMDIVCQGIADVFNGYDTLFSDSQKQLIIDNYNRELLAIRDQKLKQLIQENKKRGKEFLDKNSIRDNVVVLPSGLQYYVFREGTGYNPKITDSISIHYRLSYIDGTIIEETYNKVPLDVGIRNLNLGLAEGLLLMKPGAIYDFYIPSNLAFGDTIQYDKENNVKIPGGSALIYHVELLKIHRWWYRRYQEPVDYSTPEMGNDS
ncbi:FKBP-type peptidyl-prolyl cis-trans isomerase N-terminal domain-containing protein [Bacteroidota bacterium]